jgi:hypothetical protein
MLAIASGEYDASADTAVVGVPARAGSTVFDGFVARRERIEPLAGKWDEQR